MIYYVIEVPRRVVIGDLKVMPTSFEHADDAYTYARGKTRARPNVSTRADDSLYVYCYYVVFEAASGAEALAQARTDTQCIKLRSESPPVPVHE